jgi:DNA-binding response OmpR family regulator
VTSKSYAQSEAGHERPIQEAMTNMSIRAILPWADALSTHEEISYLELDNFHVALVPLQAFTAAHRGMQASKVDSSRLFILPLTWNELMLKLGNSASFSNLAKQENLVRFGEVTIDLASMEVCRSNRPVNLTAMEFKVLRYFVANPNRVISRDDLLDQVWGYDNYPCTRTVDNHILRLRQKLEPDFGSPVYFRTVHGMGYKFTPSKGRDIE